MNRRPAPKRRCTSIWVMPPSGRTTIVEKNTFCFLNQCQTVAAPTDWNNEQWEKLWLYNLHYFDDLNAENAALRRAWHKDLIDCWIDDNPPPSGNGWEPYPLSLRIVNWIKFLLTIEIQHEHENKGVSHKTAIDKVLYTKWLNSLALQTRVLSQRLEHHLLGNHLFANAKALVFAGLFFEGPEAEQWLAKGLEILAQEIPEQVLADGGNFELTPMYHSIMLMDLLDLINLAKAFPHPEITCVSPEWERVAAAMVAWIKVMTHPDGEISFFNDAAMGIALPPQALCSYAKVLGVIKEREDYRPCAKSDTLTLYHLNNSGYLRLENHQAVALIDVAKVGPDYIPGHAHADTLSFELSLFGQRVFVNSGISCYGLSAERLRQRGTAAHNTVVIDNQDSSEVWSGFRVARRAYPQEPELLLGPDSYRIQASHNGYRWLKGKPKHSRAWSLTAHSFAIEDTISGLFTKAVARFHLHPSVRCEESGDTIVLTMSDGKKAVVSHKGGCRRIEQSLWHPEFGVAVENLCLVFEIEKHESEKNASQKSIFELIVNF